MEFAKEDGNTIQSRISTTIIEVVNAAIKQNGLPSSKKLSKKFYKYSNLNNGGYKSKTYSDFAKNRSGSVKAAVLAQLGERSTEDAEVSRSIRENGE